MDTYYGLLWYTLILTAKICYGFTGVHSPMGGSSWIILDRAMQHSFVGSAIPVLTLSAINLQGAEILGDSKANQHISLFTGYPLVI